MMRVAILGVMNLKHMEMISLYTSFFDEKQINYDIIYIDKYGEDECSSANTLYKFETNGKTSSLFGKIIYALRFKKYASKILVQNKYDYVVVWREETSAIFSNFLKKYYRGRYIVNIRDLWDRKNIFLTLGVKKALKHSCFNTISSRGFLPFLPKKCSYVFVNSFNPELANIISSTPHIKNDNKIRILTIGTFRNDNFYFNMVDSFRNDERFDLLFVGQGSERMDSYSKRKGYNNVHCYGAFVSSDIPSFLSNADIINCASGASGLEETTKIPIRFYYAIFCKLPILVNQSSYLYKVTKELDICISVDEQSEMVCLNDYVYTCYMSLINLQNKKIEYYKNKIFEENNDFREELERIFL